MSFRDEIVDTMKYLCIDENYSRYLDACNNNDLHLAKTILENMPKDNDLTVNDIKNKIIVIIGNLIKYKESIQEM